MSSHDNDTVIVDIPGNMLDQLEYLAYQMEGYKQLIRYLSSQGPAINKEALDVVLHNYEEYNLEYRTTLSLLTKEYYPGTPDPMMRVRPHFVMGALIFKRPGGRTNESPGK